MYGAQITPSTIPELLNSVKYACKKEGVKEAYRDLLKVTKDMNANLFLKVGMTLDESEDDRCSIELHYADGDGGAAEVYGHDL